MTGVGKRRPRHPRRFSVPVVQLPAPAKAAPDSNGELEGRLEPGSEIEIRTSLLDYPVHLKANAGDFVQKGQLLVELGDSKLEESVNQAEAALNLVKTEFQQRQARLAQSDKEQSSPGSLQVPSQRRCAMPPTRKNRRLRRRRHLIVSSRTSRSRRGPAKLALAETRIVAPISGYVIQRQADGELSKPDVVLMRIVDISTVKAAVQVSPQMNSRVVADQEAHVTLNEMPGRTFLGKVLRKPSVRNLRVHDNSISIEVANPETLLKPGMYARVRLMFDQNNEPRLASLSSWYGKAFPGGKGPDGKAVGPQSRRRTALQSERPDANHEHDGERPRAPRAGVQGHGRGLESPFFGTGKAGRPAPRRFVHFSQTDLGKDGRRD